MSKLTEAQRRELKDMAGHEYASHYPVDYKPVQKLISLGLAEELSRKFGAYSVRITPAGRQALEAREGRE